MFINHSSWYRKIWRRTAVFCIVIGMIVSKTLREALFLSKKAVMGYAIDNNLLQCNWSKSVRKLAHDTTDSDLISCIKHRVG
jgi:hypothetical protein